ncbi:MAG: cation transporter [Syntrophus sp. (in: bacteria)]|nr:cation transporter [Syntrophus sp. (in: bacteria)]
MDSQSRKVRVAALSVISNTTLVIMKLIVGLLTGSISIISEAIHSGVDLIAAIITLFSVKTSSLPPDKRHPFGHGKIENISGAIEALLIFAAAGWIIFEAFHKLWKPEPLQTLEWGVGVMLVSVVVNYFVSGMLFKVAKETDSIALEGDAWHLRTDVYTSAGIAVSLSLIWSGQALFPGLDLNWLDPVAAIAVAALIIKAAYDLTLRSSRDLLDATLPPEEEKWIRQRILHHRPVICGFHQLRTRKSGHFRFVEFHLKVDPEMSVQISHAITEDLSLGIEKQFPSTSVMIHIEPCDGDCEGNCLEGCLLDEHRRREQQRLMP